VSVFQKLKDLKRTGKKGLVMFFTAGDQPLGDLHSIIDVLASAGADVIEIGMPFSDPFGEGPVIQGSSHRSLKNGTTTERILAELGKQKLPVPVLAMGYYNPVLKYGLNRFANRLHKSRGSAAILSDLLPDEGDAWCKAASDNSVETIFLVAPTSTNERIKQVIEKSTGFIYAVSRTGVTGMEDSDTKEAIGLVARVRAETDKPVCVGFGISTPSDVEKVCNFADGAIVGSALVKLLHKSWDGGKGKNKIEKYVHNLSRATI